eukprot:227433-Hanusia_phi.AAC.3
MWGPVLQDISVVGFMSHSCLKVPVHIAEMHERDATAQVSFCCSRLSLTAFRSLVSITSCINTRTHPTPPTSRSPTALTVGSDVGMLAGNLQRAHVAGSSSRSRRRCGRSR